jgi:serine/threonine protein kinase
LSWHRLQRHATVARAKIVYAQENQDWKTNYPLPFRLLHKGSLCRNSTLLGQGAYASVYGWQGSAYKVVNLGVVKHVQCNLKELFFFHSLPDHANLMKPLESQLTMEHGRFKRVIHKMPQASATLGEYIAAGRVTTYTAFVTLFQGILQGLDVLHTLGVVHGDLKPNNILLMRRPGGAQVVPKISDFTLTTLAGWGGAMSLGSLYWRAPECLQRHAYTRASDVWSVGMMMLDCCFGCTFGKDLLKVHTNTEYLYCLHLLLGETTSPYAGHHPVTATTARDTQGLLSDLPVPCLQLTPEEKTLVNDLLGNMLRWDADKRATVALVLRHPLFQSSLHAQNDLACTPPTTAVPPVVPVPVLPGSGYSQWLFLTCHAVLTTAQVPFHRDYLRACAEAVEHFLWGKQPTEQPLATRIHAIVYVMANLTNYQMLPLKGQLHTQEQL